MMSELGFAGMFETWLAPPRHAIVVIALVAFEMSETKIVIPRRYLEGVKKGTKSIV
jgi:hypothetical protein